MVATSQAKHPARFFKLRRHGAVCLLYWPSRAAFPVLGCDKLEFVLLIREQVNADTDGADGTMQLQVFLGFVLDMGFDDQ